MTQRELKRKLFDFVSEYFSAATVSWGKVKSVSPNVPQAVLNMGAVTRHYHPIVQTVGGVLVNVFPSKTTLQIDLYTKGAATNADQGVTAAFENTAVDDLADFTSFLSSAYADDWRGLHDVSIRCRQIQDLTELVNDVAWDYRAMVELDIGFTQTAVGHAGIMHEKGVPYYDNGRPKYDEDGNPLDPQGNIVPPELDGDGNPIPRPPPQFAPTPSGGRSQTLADQFTGWFEEVEGPHNKREEE